MRVLVIGAGYVGLTSAVVLAKKHNVFVVDKDIEKIRAIKSSRAPFHEPGLSSLLERGIKRGFLRAGVKYPQNSDFDVAMICVGTPPNADGTPNLFFLKSVVEDLNNKYDTLFGIYPVIALRSTVSPSTTRECLLKPLLESHSSRSFGVVYSPEFLAQGRAIKDITDPDRLVIGATSEEAFSTYSEMVTSCSNGNEYPVIRMSLESAELAKLSSNYILAAKISLANEIATIAEKIEHVDVDDVISAIVSDRRINPAHMRPGLGFGGSCFPKDTLNLLTYSRGCGVRMPILESVIEVNIETTTRLVGLLEEVLGNPSGRKVAVLGLSFKCGTDDARCSPSLDLIQALHRLGADIYAHDPGVRIASIDDTFLSLMTITDDLGECLRGADALFLMTDWPLYIDLGIEHLTSEMRNPIFIDGRRAFDRKQVPDGIIYRALGVLSARREFEQTGLKPTVSYSSSGRDIRTGTHSSRSHSAQEWD